MVNERQALFTRGPEPRGSEEAVAGYYVETGKPKYFESLFGYDLADGLHAAVGGRHDQDTEWTMKGPGPSVPGHGELEIAVQLFSPHRKMFVPKVNFKECGHDAGWGLEFRVPVGNKTEAIGNRLVYPLAIFQGVTGVLLIWAASFNVLGTGWLAAGIRDAEGRLKP